MTASRDPDRLIRAFLEEGPVELPDRAYDAVRSDIDRTRQRLVIVPWRFPRVNKYTNPALAAAAVLVAVVIGISLLAIGGGRVGGGSPSPALPPSPSPSTSPSLRAPSWPTGNLEPGRIDATLGGIPFSFAVPSGWRSSGGFIGMIEHGIYPTTDRAYINFDMDGTALRVFADPCAHVLGPPIGASASALADAMTTIPGTDAVGPTDVTVGGLPAKVVELTIHDDVECGPREFALYGVAEDSWWYLDSLDSTIRDWIFEVDIDLGPPNIGRKRVVIHSDQASPGDELAQEIQQIVDSIQFE